MGSEWRLGQENTSRRYRTILRPICFGCAANVATVKAIFEVEEGDIRIWLPVHCLSALSDRQPDCHTNAASSPC